MNAGPQRPWLQRPEWEGGVVRLRRRHGLIAHWLGAAVWNALSVPLLIGTWRRPGDLAGLPLPGQLVIAGWVLFGVFLAVRAVVVTLRARRFGDVVLDLDPFPGGLGGQMGGRVTVPARVGGEARARASLHCVRTRHRVEDDTARRKREVLWSTEVVPEVRQTGNESRLYFVFDVPGDLPESEPPSDTERNYWAVRLVARLPGADLDRVFEVPVYRIDPPPRASEPFHPPERDLHDIAHGRIDARPLPGGVEIEYRRGRWGWLGPGTISAGVFFGATATVAWTLAGAGSDSGAGLVALLVGALFALVLAGIGGILLLAGLHMSLSRRTVTIQADRIRTRSWWLFLPSETEVDLDDLTSIESKMTSASGSGTERVGTYTFIGHLRDGATILLGDGIRGTYLAGEVGRVLEKETGLVVSAAPRT